MRNKLSFLLLVLAALTLFGALAADSLPPSSLPSQELVGYWQGFGRIDCDWTSKYSLRLDFTVTKDGSVQGTLGDAKIVGARWQKSDRSALPASREVVLSLEGALIAADNVVRKEFRLFLEMNDELKVRLEGDGVSAGEKVADDASKEEKRAKAPLPIIQISLMKLRQESSVH